MKMSENRLKTSENCTTEPSLWYEVIRRFVRSKVFGTPFALRLLYKTLQEACGATENLEAIENYQPKGEIESSKAPKYLLPDPGDNAHDRSVTEDISKYDLKKSETKLSFKTLKIEESCVLKETTENGSDHSDITVPYISKDDFPDVSVLDGEHRKANNRVVHESLNGKSDFFSSSSSGGTDTDDSFSSRSNNKQHRNSKDEKGNEKKENIITKTMKKDEVDNELNELEKLLKMTDVREVSTKATTSNSVNCAKSNKNKPEDIGLLDCLSTGDGSANCSLTELVEEKANDENLLAEVNDEVKNCFLLTTSEEESSVSEIEPEKEPPKKVKKKKNKTLDAKKRRKDDLRAYRVSDTSSEEVEGDVADNIDDAEVVEEVSPLTETVIESSDSVEAIEEIPKEKMKKIKEKRDSSSDGIEICSSQSSPTKGRKNIKQIIKKESLQVETKQALKMENERKKRLSERQKLFDEIFTEEDDLKMVLDFDPDTKKELVVVDDVLVKNLKPHQRQGIRFMWNSCFESVKRMEQDNGSGCVLAHCMGLGKTLQVITLIHTLFKHKLGIRTVMVLCPLNIVKNWSNEFRLWLTNTEEPIHPLDITLCKNYKERMGKIRGWSQRGGVLVISYEMFRSLLRKGTGKVKLEDWLVNPGPDLVVCDEGHVLKNQSSLLSKCISRIRTLRRIVLTGTPLQNNLIEYYCMVQFVKPNLLGTRKEFMNRFVNPINNGQFEDSTQLDVRIMKRRAHVLHTMLNGFIQRFSYSALTPFLPEKQEYVISISLTEAQTNVYKIFVDICQKNDFGLFKDFHLLQRVWTHPKVILNYFNKLTNPEEKTKEMISCCKMYMSAVNYMDVRGSGKLMLLFQILKKCKEIGDKVLLFSQSLNSLNLIEEFLQKLDGLYLTDPSHEYADEWKKGIHYFRLDGSTNSANRNTYCQNFNKSKCARLFLISTRAGGLGINLVGANRVVVFDASWNPSHDVQSIFRVYRYGQVKPCYIYRFLASGTMEEKIYKRQVTKLSLAHRILDEHQIERHYTMGNLQELYTFDPIPKEQWQIPKLPKDSLFAEILNNNRDIIVGYHEHDSLLENKEEEELTEEERQVAWEEYEKEKLTPAVPQYAINNGVPKGYYMEKLNMEALKVVHKYKQGITEMLNYNQNQPQFLMKSNEQNESLRIVNVTSLAGSEMASRPNINHVLETGRQLGINQLEGEDINKYLSRVSFIVKTVRPWMLKGQEKV